MLAGGAPGDCQIGELKVWQHGLKTDTAHVCGFVRRIRDQPVKVRVTAPRPEARGHAVSDTYEQELLFRPGPGKPSGLNRWSGRPASNRAASPKVPVARPCQDDQDPDKTKSKDSCAFSSVDRIGVGHVRLLIGLG